MTRVFSVCIPHTFRDAYDYLPPACEPLPGATAIKLREPTSRGLSAGSMSLSTSLDPADKPRDVGEELDPTDKPRDVGEENALNLMAVQPGTRVWVSFRGKRRLGWVLGVTESELPLSRLKAIEDIIDEKPLLSDTMLKLCRWVSSYYQSPLSEVLPLVFPKKYREGKAALLPKEPYYQRNQTPANLASSAKKQCALLDVIRGYERPVSLSEIKKAGFNQQHLQPLIDKGLLDVKEHLLYPYPPQNQVDAPLKFNEEQAVAFHFIREKLDNFHCVLLEGVTGSGKTEVYLQLMAETLAKGRQVLFLVPEIGLTPQLIARFRRRVLEPMVVIHSALNDSERQQAWQLAAEGAARLVIGTRTAVFTEMPDLGLIIIDEEHDSSFKQMDGVRYSARDTAIMRASSVNIPILLGTATPCLETLSNALDGKYHHLFLHQKALNKTPLNYRLVDIRDISTKEGLAPVTLSSIQRHLDAGQQVLVFINRRGFAPVMLCHHCGWMADCPACDAHLTLHRQQGRMNCHHCGLSQAVPRYCKSCKSPELVAVGLGTQRIHEGLEHQFPGVQMLRVDRDQTRGKEGFSKQLSQINSGEAQLLIGTQMLAKGHHFPRLSLVVILDADAGLFSPDFRSIERFGQLITQVAGRAGRADTPGEVIIQTRQPQHPLLNELVREGYSSFAKALLNSRKQAALPPYAYLALLRTEARREQELLQFLHAVKRQFSLHPVQCMGPAPAPLARKDYEYRMQLLVKAEKRSQLAAALYALRQWLDSDKRHQRLRLSIDVDPQDLS